ncbi:MAG: hypothetical protein IPI32_00475 [Austwickia sp.]|nr:hypothetical protein [Austwickia sp.]MBK9102701.1 hypothetical protein [Austwickia sp.]
MIPLSHLTDGLPQGRPVPAEEIAALVTAGRRVLVVLDDDPTGTQSVADLPVLTGWSAQDLEWALTQGAKAVYVMTNSRSLDPAEAAQRNREVARAALAASAQTGVPVGFVSRGDSTLRGHFPLETDTLAEELAAAGTPVDGVVLVPAFGDAGRITVHGVHYMGSAEQGYVPVGETEFAQDATFGYAASALADWVQEKTGGRIAADDVVTIDAALLRTDEDAVVERLLAVRGDAVVAPDCLEENDLRLLALALERAESAGRRFLYRVGPPFVRGRIGQDVHPPLTRADVDAIAATTSPRQDDDTAGLVVVGSHVGLTTRQLDALRSRRSPLEIEIDVAAVLGTDRDAHLSDVVDRAVAGLATATTVVRTSRTLVKAESPQESLDIARQVSAAVVEVVQRIVAARPPRFVIAKGGITSSDVATLGLGIHRAFVRGPMLPGIVSLWEPVDGPARGIPYVVFAGNVGGDESLADVVDTLSS